MSEQANIERDEIDAWIEIHQAEKQNEERSRELADLENKLCMRESAIEDEIARIADYDEMRFVIERAETQYVLRGLPVGNHFQTLAERLQVLLGTT